MKKKIHRMLNIIMGSLTGVFLGSGAYRYWHFRKYPEQYVAQSAPWYTGILIQGLFTLALLTICLIMRAVLIEDAGAMKKTALILGIIFLSLTFVGGGYVILQHGHVNAGYAVVPGLWAIICFGYYRNKKQD
ncbi:MAG: hypothetical protein K2P63_05990 [Lachnospiraceae bacterium]|nr:hypothetical protein [Lachnospiraceae bacterium]